MDVESDELPAVWMFQKCHGAWQEMDPYLAQQHEHEFVKGSCGFAYICDAGPQSRTKYEINLLTMIQQYKGYITQDGRFKPEEDEKKQTKRRILRVPGSARGLHPPSLEP